MPTAKIARRALLALVSITALATNSHADSEEQVPAKPYYSSSAEADARLEQQLEAYWQAKGPVRPIDPNLLPPASPAHQEKVDAIRDGWDKNFDKKGNLIKFGEKPPPPPNGQFKKAEKGGLLKHVDKTRNARKKGTRGNRKAKNRKRGRR